MVKARLCSITVLVLCCLVLTGCSGSKDAEQAKVSDRSATEQKVDNIGQYGEKPLDKARAAQQMGEERTHAIDEAVRNQ